ncbi:MAG: beta-eliminating lyase-related protein, partial [Deltaproteobacteria bacterium]|nr:beta-eliminating lyase-related protein [Deltaproteobacteria bacterium]
MIDLRSDTVTTPTPDMLRAMTAAEVGDDVYSEDPSINRLEEEVAGILGKEAAVFTPSGSMANQIAIRLHTQPGDSVLCEEGSHTFAYEAGAGAALSGVQFDIIPF